LTEPYFLGRRMALSLDVYRRAYDSNDYRNYDLTTTGGSIGLGLPLRDDELRLNLIYRIFDQDLKQNDKTQLSNGLQSSLGHNMTSAIGYSLVYDTRDSRVDPRDGFYATFGQEFAGLGGNSRYISTTVDARAYKEILPEWGVVGILRGGGGYIAGIGRDLRASDQFQHNDNWLRGFEPQGIGPRDATTGDALGGRWYVHANAEAEFPIFGLPRELGLSGAVFTDFGAVWDTDPAILACVQVKDGCGGSQAAGSVQSNDFKPRVAAGFGIKWASPFGPLRADFAWPIIKQTGDRTQFFRIGGGTRF
jgi:outer membrane protein insertion porin family